jgi:hypothetical protein
VGEQGLVDALTMLDGGGLVGHSDPCGGLTEETDDQRFVDALTMLDGGGFVGHHEPPTTKGSSMRSRCSIAGAS